MPGQPPLTSRSTRVKAARRLTRRATRLSERQFLAEGPQAVREALAVPGCVVEVFATYDATTRHHDLAEACTSTGVAWRCADDVALATLTDTVTPQGVVAVCRFLEHRLDAVLAAAPKLVAVCAAVRDPGNAGAVIRCADAAGATAVVLAGTSVDPYNSKVVRASVGSLFHLPVLSAAVVGETVATLKGSGLSVLAADGSGELSLDQAADSGLLAKPTAWVFGNEAWGMPAEELALADSVVRVPIYGRAESLNLATAAALCLYASARAQRATNPGLPGQTRSPQRGAAS